MTFDDSLRRTFDSLAQRVREETEQQLASLTAEFSDTIESERAAAAVQAATAARSAAEQEAAERLTLAIAAAEAREREAAAAAIAAVEVRERQAVAVAVAAVEVRQRDAVAAAVAAGETRQRDAVAAAVATVEARQRQAIAAAVAAVEMHELQAIAGAVAAAETRERDLLAAAEIRERAAIVAAEARAAEAAREAGRAEGRELGLQQGLKDGRHEGRVEGRIEGREEGREEGRLEGRRAGHESGLLEGRQRGLEEGRQQGFAEGREQGRREGLSEGRDEGLREGQLAAGGAVKEAAIAEFRAAELAANERLVEAIRAIDAARSLTEVIDALASAAGREAARVAVVIVRSGQLRGWRFLGFDRALADRRDVDVPTDRAGVIAEAARTGLAVSADSAVKRSMPSFAALPPGRELLAVPVQMSGQVIAVLYADQGPTESAVNLSWPTSLELMARHAARCLEAITAYRAAQVLTERPDLPAVMGVPAQSEAAGAGGEDDVQAARRYARLLVSEIKLYHETAVLAGRREQDLATRLGGEIARARVLYEQRVPGEARRGSDYFQEELIRTLADGDASLLEVKN